jgi:hypothetical protein
MLLLAFAMPAPAASRRRRARIPIKPVGLLDWGGNWYLRGTIDGDERTSGNTVTTEEQLVIEEGIELDSHGYIYHPNLVDWIASLRMGLSQESRVTNGFERKTNGTLLGYNLSAAILKEKLVSLRVFANQSQNLRDQSFEASIRAENQRMGVVTTLRGPFPASLLVETGTDTEESERRTLDSDITHINFKIADRRYTNWLTQFEFDREDIDEISTFTSPGQISANAIDQSELVDEARITNNWRFGPGQDKHSLTGSINLLDRKGYSPNKRMFANQQLDLRHSKTLNSFYRGRIGSNETGPQTEDTLNGEIGVMKKFYKSLDVTLRAEGRNRTIDDDTEDIIGGFLDANYRKRTPIGLYTSALNMGRENRTETSQSDQLFNQDDPVTLKGLAYSFLTSDNIVDTSIVVTDTNNTLPAYIRGIDYQIRKTGQVTEIARLGGGIIANGQTVFVDYITEGTGNSKTRTDILTWQHRLAIKQLPLSVYTRYSLRDEVLVDGNDPDNLDRNRTFLVGTELDWKGLRVALEREQRDSVILLPSLAHRARVSYIRPIGRQSRLSLNGQIEKVVYSQAADLELQEGDDTLDTVGANAVFTTKIGRNTLLNLTSTYLKSEGRTNNMEFSNGFSLQWQYGKMDLSIDGTYDIYEQEETTGTAFNLMFNLKREF